MLSSLRRSVSTSFNRGNSNSITVSLIRLRRSIFIHNIHSSPSSSFVVNYLINSCGLSEVEATAASKTVNFSTSTNPDSVLALLEINGFTKPHISRTISKFPSILICNPQKTLEPKFDFFKSEGFFSGIELAKFFSSNPTILESSLQDRIVPCCDTLKNIFEDDQNVVDIIKRHSWLLTGNFGIKDMMVNIGILRDEGVPQPDVIKLLIKQPSALTISTSKFKEIVQEINSMGFHPSKPMFLTCLEGLTSMSKATWEAKVNVYKKWGWSENEIQSAFEKHPQCMIQSEKKTMSTMDYLVNEMGYDQSLIAKCPRILTYSLEKRIMPRCDVIQLLVSQGQIKKPALSAILTICENAFLKKYVNKYEAKVPELLKVYRTSLDSTS